jgi:hypothetical protein
MNFFRKFFGAKMSTFFFRQIQVKNISFDAESDVGEGYMVAFDLFYFILVQTAIFGKKMKFRNEQYL